MTNIFTRGFFNSIGKGSSSSQLPNKTRSVKDDEELIISIVEKIDDKALVEKRPIVKIIKSMDTENGFLQSKFGGTPAMYDKMMSEDIKKLETSSFMCQINLKDLPYNPVLPKSGILQFWEDDIFEEKVQVVYIPIKDAVSYANYTYNDLDGEAKVKSEATIMKFVKSREYYIKNFPKLVGEIESKINPDTGFDGDYFFDNRDRLMETINEINQDTMFGSHYDVQNYYSHKFDDGICILSLSSDGDVKQFYDDGTIGLFIKRKLTNLKPGIVDDKLISSIFSSY